MTEPGTPETPSNSGQETVQRASDRIEPILAHLKIVETEIDMERIRTHFDQLWEFEKGDEQEPEEQYLTTVALFIYTTHSTLEDYNINVKRTREYVTEAFRGWIKPELDKMTSAEKASDNPFKTFVDQNLPRVDDIYSWRHFQLDHKKNDESGWTFKMKSCWFATFFIRLGRTDLIQTACSFDSIPAEERQDYVDLKLTNTFSKLGSFCEFKYTPKKG
ncbi:MAG: L-2-amino-thiazoline-4-carboxylic acid hydrolase [Nitrospinota bacterium]|nr:L-2-amino-thiazoline-4-carboxylic acid hydrolase [Nitrospinota bacterium]